MEEQQFLIIKKAFEKSIQKWKDIIDIKSIDLKGENCSLCCIFTSGCYFLTIPEGLKDSTILCPVREYVSDWQCRSTPYWEWLDYHRNLKRADDLYHKFGGYAVIDLKSRRLAKNELFFLEMVYEWWIDKYKNTFTENDWRNKMDEKIETFFARKTLKAELQKCTPEQQNLFKRMYSHKKLELDIESVVDNMPIEKIDWAIQQVERTLSSNLRNKMKTDKQLNTRGKENYADCKVFLENFKPNHIDACHKCGEKCNDNNCCINQNCELFGKFGIF